LKDSDASPRILFMAKLRQLFIGVFGNVSWQPPDWFRARTRRRAVAASLMLLVVAAFGGWRAYQWYKHLPQPRRVAVHADPLPVTMLEKVLHPPFLALRFDGSVAPLDGMGKLVTSGIRIEPEVPGTWRWQGDRSLVFRPARDWPADTKYRVHLEKEVVAGHVILDRYEVGVQTPPFAVNVNKLEFYQDPKDPALKQVVATLEFTHSLGDGELEKCLSLTMLGGSPVFKENAPPFTVDYGLHRRIAYVHSAPLTLPEREDFMKLAVDKSIRTSQGGASAREGLEEKVLVPDCYSFFKIDSADGAIVRNNDGDPEQILIVTTTADIKSEDIAKSMQLFLLPKKPADDDDKPSGDEDASETGWQSPSEVDEDVLKLAKPVRFSLVPSDRETSKEHTFKIKVETGGSLYLRIPKGVRAPGGFLLGDDYNALVAVPEPDAEIEIQGKGGLLALSGERKLSIRSRGVPVIEYTIARVPADEINHLVSQTEGDFENPAFLGEGFDENDIARIATEKQPINVESRFKLNYSTFDFSSHLGPVADGGSPMQGLFFLTAEGWDPKTKKYLENVSEKRFILVTDIGMLVKENADGSRDVFLQSLKSHEALGGVPVDILARNGVPVLSGSTSADGRVTFPSSGEPTREKEPVAIVARNGNDVGFIPYDRGDRELDFSRFEVDGIQSVSGAELAAFVFTERGVYRPGDEMHIAFCVKQRNWGGNLEGLPVETEVTDARGLSVQVKKLTLPASGFAEFGYQSAGESPTGEYAINVYLVRDGKRDTLLGSTSALVKEFLPDRMKIESHLSKENAAGWVQPEGWVNPKGMQAFVTLRNLYGTPATNRRIVSRMVLCPSRFEFDAYKDYTFFDRLRDAKDDVKSETVELGEKTTNDEGAVQTDLNLERFADATYEMTFYAEGFEAAGGRSVNAESSVLVSPLPYVIGYKADADLGYIKMNSKPAVEFIAIDNALKRAQVGDLQLKLIEQSYVSILRKQEDGTYAYDSVRKERVALAGTVNISEAGLKYLLPTDAPGNYILELRDGSGTRVSKLEFSVVGLGRVARSLDKNAELEVKLDREQYNSGEEIEVSITAPYTGSGLITIERDKVYAHQWFKAAQTASVQHIRLPEGFDGTGYVNVSFIRAPDSKEIYMSPLSYAVAPFTANREKRKLKIGLQAAAHAKPGEPLTISYKTDRPAKIIVFAVDEGILQVTGYEVPDPLEYYFQKSALMVKTSQIVDLILPEYSILRSAAFGGDGEARQLNPFKRITEKPVVFWSGILDADTTARNVVYPVPDYFSGTLTVMAVAISPDAAGSLQQDSLIRGPFVITPGVPTLAAPGDRFDVGVTVANGQTQEEVTLTVEPSEHLEVVKSPEMPLHIPQGREVSATFTVLAKEKLGSASLLFMASAAGETSTLRSTLSVRPATPLMTQVRGGNFTKTSIDLPIQRSMRPEFRKLEAVVSALPLGLAHGLDSYLKDYPNGCSEQLTSGAFCRLMIADEADFGLTRAEVFDQLEKTFAVLRRRQDDQGGFGYWGPERNDGIDFISTYVMHFLIEAKAAGFSPPADMFQSGLRNLQRMVVKEPRDLTEARTVAYAIYLLTREEVITTNYILNLRDFLDKRYEGKWEGDLTGVYLAGALSILKNSDEAETLITAYHIGVHDREERGDFYQPLGEDSQYIAVVARHFPDVLRGVSAADFQAIAGPVGDGDFNTLSAAYAVLALKSYSRQIAADPPELAIQERTKEGRVTVLPATGKLLKRAGFSERAVSLRFSAKPRNGKLGAFYQVIETGFDVGLADKPVAEGLEIHREFVDEAGHVTNVARLGEPLTVKIRIRSLSDRSITNVAIVDMLPGGFEIVGSSLRPGAGSCGCDYVDVREDRAVFFATVETGVREIDYQIKPDNKGEFVVPPVFAESMYDRSIRARGLSGRISVTDPK